MLRSATAARPPTDVRWCALMSADVRWCPVNIQYKFQDHNLKIKNRVLTENACARRRPARLSDYHQKVIRDAAYGGEH